MKSLEQYYREKGKHPPPQTPFLAGKPISLHLLFERVTKLGGSFVLSQEDRWQDILAGSRISPYCSFKLFSAFNLSPPSASLAYGLRKIYKDFLEVSFPYVCICANGRSRSRSKNYNYTARSQTMRRRRDRSIRWMKFPSGRDVAIKMKTFAVFAAVDPKELAGPNTPPTSAIDLL